MSPSEFPLAAIDPSVASATPTRPVMRSGDSDLRRLRTCSILASFAVAVFAAGFALRGPHADATPTPPTSRSAASTNGVVTTPDDLVAAIAHRRELASLPIIAVDSSLQTSAQGWADSLAGHGLSHDPALLDGISDDWQKVAELVSSGPNLTAAAHALLGKPAGSSPLDDPKITTIGIGSRVDGATTYLVIRLLKMPSQSAVEVQMGF